MISTRIIATGSYLPSKIVTNDDMTQFPSNARKLIAIKTGVLERRHAAIGECTSDLAARAARNCIDKANLSSLDIDTIILATSSPDRFQPATATRVQHLLGAKRAFAFDINSVCSGSTYGLALADSLIKSEMARTVILIGAEIYSRFLNPKDFSTFPYFGDGAGAVLLSKTEDGSSGIVSLLKSDGAGHDVIQVRAGGSMTPFAQRQSDAELFFTMNGKKVFEFAVFAASEIINEITDKYETTKDNIQFIIPHQANINIITEIAKNTGIAVDKFFVNLQKLGNVAGASVLIALNDLLSTAKVQRGDKLLTVAFGGGLSWGANLITY